MDESKSAKNPQKKGRGTRGPYTPETTQTRIIAKKLAGETNSAIAREVGVDRSTVREILSHKKYRELVEEFRPDVLGIIPKALRVYNKALDMALEGVAEDPPKDPQKIEVLDGAELKRRIDQAYKRGLAAGMDAVKAATETLKGSQVFSQRQEVAVEEQKPVHELSDEELQELFDEAVACDGRYVLKGTKNRGDS